MLRVICTASVSEPDTAYAREWGEAGSGSLTLAVQKYRDIPETLSCPCISRSPHHETEHVICS